MPNFNSHVYWIDGLTVGRLAILSRPHTEWLTEDVSAWKSEQINVVIDLLAPEERYELGLAGEESACRNAGIDYVSFPIADRGVPPSREVAANLVRTATLRLRAAENIGVHCRAGIGRSGLIAACVLMANGATAEAALAAVGRARGVLVPDTDEQRTWIRDFEARR